MRLNFLDVPVTDAAPLPEYSCPPVVEVSVGVQFTGLRRYTSFLAADFYDQVKRDYPLVEEHPPLDPAFETFGGGSGGQPVRFELVAGPLQPRFFFLSHDSSELLQFQKDRLHYNWRKTAADLTYPRFPTVRSDFGKAYKRLEEWVRRHDLGSISITQCEVVYVNSIPLVDAANEQCGLSKLFPWFEGLPGRTEDGNFQFRQPLVDDAGRPTARLTCTLQYGTDAGGRREARLMLLVRGRPNDTQNVDLLEFFDEGRKIIVHTFTNITTTDAHRLWGRTQ
jgi:uncharacterized protein (TIGR04255 family)